MNKEIEKKFLVEKLPSDLKIESSKEIHQTYLAIGNEEIRVRKITKGEEVSYTMTIKKGSGLTREEMEFEISKETYEQLLLGGQREPLIKTRNKVIVGKSVFDLDIYKNSAIENLKTIEIEFDSEKEANSFVALNWFKVDVTNDKNYKNQFLWKEIQSKS